MNMSMFDRLSMSRPPAHFIVVADLRAAEPILSGCDHSGMSYGTELAQVRAALAEADRL